MTLSINIPKRGTALTNGDIIKAIFPNAQIEIRRIAVYVTFTTDGNTSVFDPEWWTALYQEKKI